MPDRGDRTRTLFAIYSSALAILAALTLGILLVEGNGDLASRSAKFELKVIAKVTFYFTSRR